MLKISAFAPPNVVFCVLVKQKTIFVKSVSFDSAKNRLKLISYFLVLYQLLAQEILGQKDMPVSYCPFKISFFLLFKFNRISSNCSHSWFAMHDLFLRKTSDADAGLFTKVKSYYELTRHSIISIVSPV